MTKLQLVAQAIWAEIYQQDHVIEWVDVPQGSKCHVRTMRAARAALEAHAGIRGGADWRPIPGFPRYEASSLGDIRRTALPDGTPVLNVLKPYQNRITGHCLVSVYRDGKQFRQGVHRLIALTFHGPAPKSKPLACHNNGDAGDNRAENLRWGSHKENTADMLLHRRMRRAGSVEIPWTTTKKSERSFKFSSLRK